MLFPPSLIHSRSAKPLEDPFAETHREPGKRPAHRRGMRCADIRNTGRLLTLSETQLLQAASLEVGREIANLGDDDTGGRQVAFQGLAWAAVCRVQIPCELAAK